MKRKTGWILAILAVLMVAGYLGTTVFIGSIVRTGVNTFAPSITHTSVHLDGASLSPLSGSGTLTGLLIGNPEGWPGDKALYFKKIHIKVVPQSIFSDCIVISEMTVEGPDFVYETKIVSSNIGALLKNIQGSSSDKASTSLPVDKQGKPLRFIVKHFALTNGRVTVGFGPTAITLPVPSVTLDDIGTREGGISPADLSLALMRSVTSAIVTATTNAAGKIGSTMGAAASNSAKAAGDALKNLFGGNK